MAKFTYHPEDFSFFFQLLMEAKNFQENLDDHHEAVFLASAPNGDTVRVDNFKFISPDLICCYGTDSDGSDAVFFCHVSQANFVIHSRLLEPDQPKRTFGFDLSAHPEYTESFRDKENPLPPSQ